MPPKPFTSNIAHPFHSHPTTGRFDDVELGVPARSAIASSSKDEESPSSKLHDARHCLKRHSLGLIALFLIVAGGIVVPVTLYCLHKLH